MKNFLAGLAVAAMIITMMVCLLLGASEEQAIRENDLDKQLKGVHIAIVQGDER